MRRITFGLFCCVLAITGCAPGGGGGSSVPPARSAQGAFAVPHAISRAVPPAPPNFVPKPPSKSTSSVRHTSDAAQAAFFSGAVPLSNGVYYLQLPGGNIFGYYSYLSDPNYIYHFDMGYEYVIDAGDGNGVYLYDFASSHWWYTSRTYEFPYLYDFSLSSVLYYYPDAQNAGRYTNPRYFYDFAVGKIIQLPEPPPSTKAVQRAQVQALLTVSKVLDTGGYYPGFATLGPMDRGRRTQSVKPVQPVSSDVCSPGGANGDGSASYSSTSDAQGRHEVYSDFYSPNCVNTQRVTTLNEPTSNTQSQGVSTGYTTQYNRAGAVIGYATNQQTWNQNLLTVVMSDAKTVGGAQVGRSGASCVPTSSTITRCNLASFMTAGGETTGLLETVTETYGGNGAWTAQISATTYAGSGLYLVQPAAGGSTWDIQGGAQIDSLSGNGTYTQPSGSSFVNQLDYTTTSSPGGYSATAHLVFNPNTLTITVSKNGATVATAVVDGDGNGTIRYADNSTDTVAGFTIFS